MSNPVEFSLPAALAALQEILSYDSDVTPCQYCGRQPDSEYPHTSWCAIGIARRASIDQQIPPILARVRREIRKLRKLKCEPPWVALVGVDIFGQIGPGIRMLDGEKVCFRLDCYLGPDEIKIVEDPEYQRTKEA